MNQTLTKIFFIVSAIIIIAILIFGILFWCGVFHIAKDVVHNLPNLSISGSVDYDPKDSGQMTINAITGMYLQEGATEQIFDFSNPSDNTCALQVEIFLADGAEVYQSGYILPGERIERDNIEIELKEGVYHNCVLVYTCYTLDDIHIPLSRCDMTIEMTVS